MASFQLPVKSLLRPVLAESNVSAFAVSRHVHHQRRSCHHHHSHSCHPLIKQNNNKRKNQTNHFSTTTPQTTDKLQSGLEFNKSHWAPSYAEKFASLGNGQQPQILWIGCSDSRCPETTILGLQPGDVFVHRNIANIIHEGDLSSSCVIDFAVGALKVSQIVICGHTSCGGVNAALGDSKLGVLDTWLLPLRKLRAQNLSTLEKLDSKNAIVKLAELNVLDGIAKIKEKSVVLEAMEQRGLKVSGLIYDVATGLLRTVDGGEESQDEIKARLTAFKTS
ncbi:Carbonic anhydrase [Talaromyces pinophilus]|nr:Carbonic anhydrase [Talaromyces pinophilus]